MAEDHVANVRIGGWDTNQDTKQRNVVLRLGTNVRLGAITSLPERYRVRASQLNGKLNIIFVQPASGEGWCRLSGGVGGQIWPPSIMRVEARTFPLNDRQPSTPPPDSIDLHPHMLVECKEDYVGKLTGTVVEAATGLITALLLQVRTDIAEIITSYGDPMRVLVPHVGQLLMIAPAWIREPDANNHANGAARLKLNATVAQVASSLVLRGDGEMLQEVWDILGKNPAVTPYLSELRVTVHDGTVTIAGRSLSPRLRASIEQNIWHIPGVLNVRNLLG